MIRVRFGVSSLPCRACFKHLYDMQQDSDVFTGPDVRLFWMGNKGKACMKQMPCKCCPASMTHKTIIKLTVFCAFVTAPLLTIECLQISSIGGMHCVQ